jgi:hypothetical protein
MRKFTGGCLCGRIRYSGEAEIVRMIACHCTNCQRFTGSAFMPVFAVPKGTLVMTGNAQVYTVPGGTSGLPLHRTFCSTCGSSLTVHRDDNTRINILAGTLDDPSFFNPTANIYCETKQAWVPLSPDISEYPGMGA